MAEALELEVHEARPRRFRPYPEYRDPGVEWLGEIPAHWETRRVMDHSTLVNGFPFDSVRFTLGDGMPLVRIRDLGSTDTEVRYAGTPVDSARIANGDILIGMDGEFNVGRWQGGDALLNQRMCCLRPLHTIDGQFLLYCLQFPLKIINDLTYSTTVKHLSSLDIKKMRLPYPAVAEQRSIAAFLERETAKIDELVAKKEWLIELLQEKRVALITRAVTQGLDLNVPMKDSGVEWLGRIPAHWETTFLDKLVDPLRRITYGIVQPGQPDPDGILMVRGQNYSRGWSPPERIFRVSPAVEAPYRRSRLKEGDIVMTIVGAGTGNVAVVPSWLERANLTQTTARIAIEGTKGINRYFAYQLESVVGRVSVELTVKGAAQPGLNLGHIAKYRVIVPPLREQNAIADILDRETRRMDALIEKVREAIGRLEEFRTALISAAVTGKIDVREETI